MKLARDFFLKEHFDVPDSLEDKKQIFKHSVSNIVVEISSHCNRKCSYCPVSKVDRSSSNKILPDEILKRLLFDLASIGYERGICLNLYNEPSSDRELLLSRIKEFRTALPKSRIYFSTNGDYLDREYLRAMVHAGLSELYITLHTPKGKPYTDAYAIHRLTEIAVRLGKSVKVNAFAHQQTLQGLISIFGIKVNVFSTNYDVFGSNRAGSVDNPAMQRQSRVAPCDRPFEDFTISYDGTIFPCCQMFVDDESHKANFSVGNLSEHESIFEIYASPKMASWRSSLLRYGPKASPCDVCSEANVPGTPDQIAQRLEIFQTFVGDRSFDTQVSRKFSRIFRLLQRS